ncbi:hypothetical protein T261_4212 [Streptomyces lydicus]|nr:hypothetical protein T261_4212 [Streptomyces lydicus]
MPVGASSPGVIEAAKDLWTVAGSCASGHGTGTRLDVSLPWGRLGCGIPEFDRDTYGQYAQGEAEP